MSLLKKLTNVTTIAAGSSVTVRIPVGPTYDKILTRFRGTGASMANVTQVRLIANAKTLQEFAAIGDLNEINKYHGRAASPTPTDTVWAEVPLYLRRPEVQAFATLSTIDAERVTSLGTKNINTLTLEFQIAPGFSAPQFEFFAEEVPESSRPIGLVTKIRRLVYNVAAAGEIETLFDAPRGPRIIALHFQKTDVGSAGNISIKANSAAIIDTVTKDALQEFQGQEGRAPVAGFTVVDFCSNGNLDEALRTSGLQDLRGTVHVNSAGALPVYIEYLDTFDGL